MREKKKKRKEEMRERAKEDKGEMKAAEKSLDDDFFGADSEDEGSAGDVEEEAPIQKQTKGKDKQSKGKGRGQRAVDEDEAHKNSTRVESTAEELALLAASDNPNGEVKHFDMKAVLRAEKKKGKKKKGKKGKNGADDGDNELQEDFSIDVKDDRFKAVLEDHTFAIDPSNPQYVPAPVSYVTFLSLTDLLQLQEDEEHGCPVGRALSSTAGEEPEEPRFHYDEAQRSRTSAAKPAEPRGKRQAQKRGPRRTELGQETETVIDIGVSRQK